MSTRILYLETARAQYKINYFQKWPILRLDSLVSLLTEKAKCRTGSFDEHSGKRNDAESLPSIGNTRGLVLILRDERVAAGEVESWQILGVLRSNEVE